jgi:hypothetical protein
VKCTRKQGLTLRVGRRLSLTHIRCEQTTRHQDLVPVEDGSLCERDADFTAEVVAFAGAIGIDVRPYWPCSAENAAA